SSNPTFANADGSSAQITQFDKRSIFGLRLEGEQPLSAAVSLRFGTEAQLDDIGCVGVSTSDSGRIIGSLGTYTALQGSASGWTEFNWAPASPIRLFGGARGDWYGYRVRALDDAALALGEGTGSSVLISPKFGAAIKISNQLEVYANWGRGFHSNDVRGAVSSTPVPLLVQGTGREFGTRLQLGNLTFTATYWWLGLGSELRFVGDSNSVEPTGASSRHGYELVAFWRPFPWLAIDGNFTASHSRYKSGEYIPNAFENAGQLGASVVFRRFELSVRWRHLGPYPLTEDNRVREAGSDIVSARASLRTGRIEIYGELLNLLGSRDKDIAYFYESFVPAFDARPVEGRMSRVVEPRTLRLGLRLKL
ncbi:MAG: TonB-dependent receptor, partial [Brevundimonas sp.]|nr:TonB-dependent receptor [Brevundimonas sp.]